jgi:DNA-binding transcriptional MerR regulator
MEKSSDAFRTISEVAEDLDLPQHVLRFWETRFGQIRPLKRGGGRRYYRPDDVELLRAIRHLLYGEGYTIKGVQKILKEQGARAVIALPGEATTPKPVDASLFDETPAAAPVADADEPGDASVAPLGSDASVPVPDNRLAGSELERLRAVLAELVECERLLLKAFDH